MKIVIVGAGVVGEALCSELSEINNDVILIEKEEDILNKVIEKNDITGLAGNGASYENLLEAGVDTADIFIAVTEADELNIISCIMAKKLGANYTIARVRNPEYTTNMRFVREELGISLMINPEEEAARTIMNTLKFPNAESVDTFFSNRANMLELLIEKGSQLAGMKLKDLNSGLKDKVIICIVERGKDIMVPTGDFILEEDDVIYVTGTNDAVANFYDRMGYKKNKDINFDNELIIATESDRNDVRQQYKNYDKTKIRFFDYDEIKDLPSIFLDNKRGFEAENFIFFYQLEKIKADNSKQLKVEISNSMGIFHSLSIYLLVYIIDKILIEKFIEGKEIKMFMIFANELAE